MDGQMPTPPNIAQTEQSPKKGLLFEIIFVVVFLVVLFGILNYFNILRLSEIFPEYLGFLPRKEVPTGTSQSNNITISPTVSLTQQAKETLMSFLPTVLSPSILPKSAFDISFTENTENKEPTKIFNASWNVQEGTLKALLVYAPDGKNIIQSYLSLTQTENGSQSAELAQTKTSQFFLSSPKGTWGCQPIFTSKAYCENFWEEKDGTRRGMGIHGLLPQGSNSANNSSAIMIFFCQHTKESKPYSWKSCDYGFSKTGVQ